MLLLILGGLYLFTVFLSIAGVFLNEIVSVKAGYKNFDISDVLGCSLIGCIPIINVILICLVFKTLLDVVLMHSNIIDKINENVTDMIRGE